MASPPVSQRTVDMSGVGAPYALDPDNAKRLWETSQRLLRS